MNEYVLTPWSNLTEEDQKYIIANQATQPGHGYIDPKDYEKSNFYTLNGRLAKGTDVDNWLKQQNTSTQVNKSLVQSFIDRMGWGQDNPIWGNRRISNFQKTYDKNPNFMDNWKVAENAIEGSNIMSGGILNRLSPTQNIRLAYDLVTDKPIFTGQNGQLGSWWGNSGIVSNQFAEDHPFYSMMINGLGDYGFGTGTNYGINKGISTLNKHPDLVAKLRHPTYKKYYHGTSADFDLKDARMGNEYNLGLHASDTPTIAESMQTRGNGINPKVIEFYAPKPSTESIDVYNNGIEQLQTNYLLKPIHTKYGIDEGYDAAGNLTQLFKLIRKYGGTPYMVKNTSYPKFNIDENVSLNLRQSVYPKIQQSEYSKIDDLLKEQKAILGSTSDRYYLSPAQRTRLSEINTEAAQIMSKYGYKTVKYNNTNPFEGGGGTSYFITDPSVIYQHTPFNSVMLPWTFGTNHNSNDI